MFILGIVIGIIVGLFLPNSISMWVVDQSKKLWNKIFNKKTNEGY